MLKVISLLLAAASFCSSACACDGTVDDWSRSFLALRPVRGHFDGGPWTASVDRWNGERHQAMQCLASHAAANKVASAQLVQWMGEPDERLRCPSDGCKAFAPLPTGALDIWVYRWRGNHDRLGMVTLGGRAVAVVWAYAGE